MSLLSFFFPFAADTAKKFVRQYAFMKDLCGDSVKNTLAMWETWVQSLGREDPLEKGTATHSSHKESDTTEWLSLSQVYEDITV